VTQKRGLIVDDDKFIRKIITNFFKKLGIDVLAAKNGSQAVDILVANKIRFILTDIQMPVMNGNKLISFIQNQFPELPVFIMSGDINCVDIATKESECVKKIFKKPFNIQDLTETIISTTSESK
jgi:DNA-binding NtrC family response regulator